MSIRSLVFSLLLLSQVSSIWCAPWASEGIPRPRHEKRQFFDAIGSLATTFNRDATYDYVVVGAGTAGLTIAARLAEQKNITVAVIEAGTFYQVSNILIDSTPGGDVLFVGAYWGDNPIKNNAFVDWKFITTPQKGANNRLIHYARGKCLGGSSARNFMIWQRPTKQSLDEWVKLTGDDSYSWDKFLPYYQKSTTYTGPNMKKRAKNSTTTAQVGDYGANNGPLPVSHANYAAPFSSWMEAALREMGMPQADSFTAGKLEGSTYCASTIDPNNMSRTTSQTSFYNYASNKSLPMTVYSLSQAKKIIFDADKKATGVIVEGRGNTYTLKARKEVIVSGGAFHTPQLLMVSGIGPAETLKKYNIPVIKEAPGVGQNMQDHVFFGPSYRVKVDTLTKLANSVPSVIASYLTEYTFRAEGVLTNPVADYLGWEKVPEKLRSKMPQAVQKELKERFPPDWPELEYLSAPGYIGDFQDLFQGQPGDGFQYATILAALVAPTSRGTVTISSNNTNDLPVIDPNWITTQTDEQVAIAAFKRAREAFQTKVMGGVLVDTKEYYPGDDTQTDEQILQNIRKSVMTVWHASCTAKMGKDDDPMAVIDSNARVYGVKGLRVVDASSFAILPPGHPQSTVYALAEKIADDIKKGN
ncbi:GMC oxidoreductase [Microthyrium microscopicum]|uniref:GMC oxidoreductase n=1 Tax=Microthyrium microscopicum TaxID=703497 RepID=A0A6A6USD5_9PEZI|nr:GMC oxidoreductase [Microthyrium microscopicum]